MMDRIAPPITNLSMDKKELADKIKKAQARKPKSMLESASSLLSGLTKEKPKKRDMSSFIQTEEAPRNDRTAMQKYEDGARGHADMPKRERFQKLRKKKD